MKTLKDIFSYIGMFWLCGGGPTLSLFGLIISWKLSIALISVWICSWIIGIMWATSDK